MVCWHDITNYLSIRQSDALQWTIISWNSSLLLSSLNPLSIKNEKKDHVEQNIYCMICSSNYHVINLVLFLVNHVCLRLCEISINSIVVKQSFSCKLAIIGLNTKANSFPLCVVSKNASYQHQRKWSWRDNLETNFPKWLDGVYDRFVVVFKYCVSVYTYDLKKMWLEYTIAHSVKNICTRIR